jgi:hypothetical protein
MDFNEYSLTYLAHERLTRAREAATRRRLVTSLTEPPSLRVRLGRVLIALGQRLLAGSTRRAPVPAPPRVAR